MSAPRLNFPYGSGGGGGVSGSGTPNALAMWATSSSLTDSPLSFSGSTMTYSSAVTTHSFAVPQLWTLPGNTQAWRINGQQLVFDGGNGYLGINAGPAAPLHVEGSVTSSELVRLRNTSTTINSPVGIQTHAANRGATTPTGKIENYPIAFTPLYGVYDWVYSLPTPSNVMTEVFRQTAPTTILTVTLTSGGSGYTNGTYSQVALTNVSSSGSGATADIVVSGGIVTVAVLRSGGSTYQVGDTLTCASIGGGTGFVLTVASVGSRATAAGNVTATRIGAGTTTPRGAFDLASGAFYATSQDLISRPSSSAGSFTTIYASVYAGATEQITKNYPVLPFSAAPRIDATLQPSATVSGYGAIPQITASNAAQNITTYGYQATVYRAQPLDVSATPAATQSVVGYYSQCGIIAGVGAASTSSVVGFASLPFISAVGHTVASFANFQASTPNFNVASTITDYYGFRQLPHTGAGTITNRWGVSIEDALATNYFAGNVGVGTVPNAWNSAIRAFDMRTSSLWNYNSGSDSVAYWTVNAYTNTAGNVVYKNSAAASQYTQIGGAHIWERAVSGVAGNAVTWLESARIDSSGILTVNAVARATGSTATAPAFSTPSDTNTGIYFPAADTLRFATAGSPAMSLTSAQVLQFDSGYGSVANAYGCRAWVNFNGTGVIAIRASGNVSSITDVATGQYVVNFTSAMPDINYAAIGTKQNVATNADVSFYDCVNAVGSIPARTVNASGWQCLEGSVHTDSANINIAYFR